MPQFLVTTSQGKIYHADANGHCDEVVSLSVPIKSAIFSAGNEKLFVLLEDLTLIEYIVAPDGKLIYTQQVPRIRLGSDPFQRSN